MISKTLARKYMAKQRELEKLVEADKTELLAENKKLTDRVKVLERENLELKNTIDTHEVDITKLKEDVSKIEVSDTKEK